MIGTRPVVSIVGIGMGPDDIGAKALKIIRRAEVLAGGRRHLSYFPELTAEKLILTGDLSGWLDRVAEMSESRRVVLLASGDPNFFGVAERAVERLGPERVEIIPNITAIQAAFAEIKKPWNEAAIFSLHGRSENELLSRLRDNYLLALYTDPERHPAWIARLLIDRGQLNWRMTVLENLGGPERRVTEWDLADASRAEFSDLNVVILERTRKPECLAIGLPDDAYDHEAGLITKSEIRAVALSKLRLGPGMTLWDLGAGCGSVGIEATLLLPGGRVAAVEKNSDRIEQIRSNQAKFGAANVEIIHGELPGTMNGLPDPDRVFVGGGGPALADIVAMAIDRLPQGGVIVVTAVMLGSLGTARSVMAEKGLATEVVLVQISRSSPLGGDEYLKSLNPVWVIQGIRS